MEITVEEKDGAIVLYLNGNLDTKYSSSLNSRLDALMEIYQFPSIIVDLGNVEYMSSSCLNVFVGTARTLEHYERKFFLCNVNNAIKKVMEIVKINKLISIYDTEKEALNNLP